MVFDGTEALGGIAGVVAVGSGFDGLAAPAGLLADLSGTVRWMRLTIGEGGEVPFCTLVLSRM